jgi:pyridoxine/pyridoxamine 5'-phosphate oxidase
MPSLAELRIECRRAALKTKVAGDPIRQFARWSDEVRAVAAPEVNTMALAAVTVGGLERQVCIAVAEFEAKHRDSDAIPRPSQWRGMRVRPDGFEFWQGRSSRWHDRIASRRDGERWRIERLAP